jgi:hypothetical protein
MIRATAMLFMAVLFATGCTSSRQTDPARTATEQLLISNAADRAATRLRLDLPPRTKVYVDSTNFEGTDAKYAIGTIRNQLLRQGAALVGDRAAADAVVEIRAGALSIDHHETLIGIPRFDIPIPLAGGDFTFPEIALFKVDQRRAVAKFAAAGYRAKDGAHMNSAVPQFGISHKTEWTVLLFISWTRTDAIPHEAEYSPLDVQPPEFR